MHDTYDVVVVGAGAAGIGAMRELTNAACSTILLEASDRVGGRALTIRNAGGPAVDLGCGWLHSAERNAWVGVAEASGLAVDRRPNAWGRQHRELGFSLDEQAQAKDALRSWNRTMRDAAPASDSAAEAAQHGAHAWLPYLRHVGGAYSGQSLEDISIADYMAYRMAETGSDWRLTGGFGQLIAGALPESAQLRLASPVSAVELTRDGVALTTPRGRLFSRAVILTVPTSILSSGLLTLPSGLESWRAAAEDLPLGTNEKLFFEMIGAHPFEMETRVIGDPRRVETGAYYIGPLEMPVVEGFFGGEAAERVISEGPAATFAFAIGELQNLFGSNVAKCLRPLAISRWRRDHWIQGSYSCARPLRRAARHELSTSFDGRIFFAGEATHDTDFSTAHGALETGVRAAGEVLKAIGVSTG